jgi:hypothetical protein
MEFGIQELSQADGESEMLAFAWDLETNVRSSQSFRFKHERHTRQGVTKLNDPRDIYETGANLGARRLRSRILSVIDQDLINAAVKQCRQTMVASVSGDNKKTLTEKLDALVKAFGKMGIKVAHIERRLGHELKDTLPEEYTDLAIIYKSLKDGMAAAGDYFDVPKVQGTSETAQKLDQMAQKGAKVDPNALDSEFLIAEINAMTPSMFETPEVTETFISNTLQKNVKEADLRGLTHQELTAILDALKVEKAKESDGQTSLV